MDHQRIADLTGQLQAVLAGAGTDIRQAALAGDRSYASTRLYLALVMLTEDAALRLVQSVSDHFCAEALTRLLKCYSPPMRSWVLSVLNGILQVDSGTDEQALGIAPLTLKVWRMRSCPTLSRGPPSRSARHPRCTSTSSCAGFRKLCAGAGSDRGLPHRRSRLEPRRRERPGAHRGRRLVGGRPHWQWKAEGQGPQWAEGQGQKQGRQRGRQGLHGQGQAGPGPV